MHVYLHPSTSRSHLGAQDRITISLPYIFIILPLDLSHSKSMLPFITVISCVRSKLPKDIVRFLHIYNSSQHCASGLFVKLHYPLFSLYNLKYEYNHIGNIFTH